MDYEVKNRDKGMYWISIVVYLLINLAFPPVLYLLGVRDLASMTFFSFMMGAILLLFLLRKPLLRDAKVFGQSFTTNMKHIGKNLVISYALMMFFSVMLRLILGERSSQNQAQVEGLLADAPFLIATLTVVFAPIIEELVFRGFFFLDMKPLIGKRSAFILSSILFGLLHVASALGSNPLELLFIIPYASTGYFMAKAVDDTGSIWGGIIMHAISNLIAVAMVFI